MLYCNLMLSSNEWPVLISLIFGIKNRLGFASFSSDWREINYYIRRSSEPHATASDVRARTSRALRSLAAFHGTTRHPKMSD